MDSLFYLFHMCSANLKPLSVSERNLFIFELYNMLDINNITSLHTKELAGIQLYVDLLE